MFLDTWMAGGLGRAQGPFDEMVFRSMVIDGSRFADPLGLASELTKTDFQVEANSSLRRALHEPPGLHPRSRIADSLDVADERLEGYYASAFKQVRACRSSRAGATGWLRAGVSTQEHHGDPPISDDAV